MIDALFPNRGMRGEEKVLVSGRGKKNPGLEFGLTEGPYEEVFPALGKKEKGENP